jgi:hypothetical protein
MKNDIKLGKQLVDELTDLWLECSQRCDRIEELIKKINEMNK